MQSEIMPSSSLRLTSANPSYLLQFVERPNLIFSRLGHAIALNIVEDGI